MALSHALGGAGTPPDTIDVSAVATFVPGEGITGMALTLSGSVPGISREAFIEAAEGAKANCPVSQALAGNVPISLEIN
jgi:osmotically inducible protein OsmC